MEKLAEISKCGRYRYLLTRRWDASKPSLIFIMLNPSTADHQKDDNTIRRCIRFARDRGFGGVTVGNLFAFRATSPKDMKAAADPIGPDNNGYLASLFIIGQQHNVPIIAAWGTHGSFKNRDKAVQYLGEKAGSKLQCLGTTSSGNPRHPLYVKADKAFEDFAVT